MVYAFKLEREDGTPADPPTLRAAVPNWRPGDLIPLGRRVPLRVTDVRPPSEPDGNPILVVVEAADSRASSNRNEQAS